MDLLEWFQTLDHADQNAVTIVAVACFLILMVILNGLFRRRKLRRRPSVTMRMIRYVLRQDKGEGKVMAKGERKQFVNQLLADELTNLLEKLRFNGDLTDKEVAHEYRRQIQLHPDMRDLKPKKPKNTKFELKMKRATRDPKEMAPVNIPGDPPTPIKEERKKLGDFFITRTRVKVA